MMSSTPAYSDYAKTNLMPAMKPEALADIQKLEAAKEYENPRYMELLMGNFYVEHILRMPPEQWPDPLNRAFTHLNHNVYLLMQGPSEMGIAPGYKLAMWDRSADLKQIKVPTLVVGARYDTMNPAHLKWMAEQFPKGKYLYCANGSHMCLYDDQKTWFDGVIKFLQETDQRK